MKILTIERKNSGLANEKIFCRFENIQLAQNGKKFEQRCKWVPKQNEKVIHNLRGEKLEKWSYTPSYPRYPQKMAAILKGKGGKIQTDVL